MRQTSTRAARKRGFTLIELLVVVAIIALLISILLPSLARARELSKRAVCAANEAGIGKGFATYASSNNDTWPIPAAILGAPADGISAVQYYNAIGAKRGTSLDPNIGETFDTTGTGDTIVSTTRAFWALVRTGASSPKSFVCPSAADDSPNADDNPQSYWDFGRGDAAAAGLPADPKIGYYQVSYGYQVPFGKTAKPNPNPPDPGMAMLADKGPYSQMIDGAKSIPPQGYPWGNGGAPQPDLSSSPDDWRKYNSPNHGGFGDGEGQNAGYADAHVDFVMTPLAGAGKDNIYTRWGVVNPAVNSADIFRGTQPVTGTYLAPFGATDSLIYP
jgi:prepilin-type N-terminal cleavage/methylation domain-containing protein